MLRRLGYACLGLGLEDCSPRGTILRNASRERLRDRHDGVPKIHYSSQAVGQRAGAHAEFVEPSEFAQFLALARGEIEFDCMLEPKAREAALFRLRDELGIVA